MSRFPRFVPLLALALAVLLWTAGCKSNQDQNAASAGQDASSDPASANLAPVSTAPEAAPSGSQQPAPDNGADNGQGPSDSSDDSYYGEQPADTASEPPPPLPEYEQPACPGDDYIWTPGYWGYVSTGYYWIPGAWVQAPYQDALWTPGYWAWFHNRYAFFRGYWGPHIGFYGGVNYGFGYVGVGYQGGYWNSGQFYYNRTVNNVNVTVVHNVYNRTVIVNNNVHASFNGGQGGIQVRPRPAELAALREPHAPPMAAQLQNQHAASIDRAQFVAVNHGRPANVVAKPLVADRDVHPVAPPAARYQAVPGQPGGVAARSTTVPPAARGNEPARPEPVQPEARPNAVPPAHTTEPARPEARPSAVPPARNPEPARQEVRPNPAPPAHSNPPVRSAEKPAPARPEATPKPAPRPPPQVSKPKPEEKPAPKKEPPEKPKPEEERHPQ
jgi:WXXGXW repeat (2 copies)